MQKKERRSRVRVRQHTRKARRRRRVVVLVLPFVRSAEERTGRGYTVAGDYRREVAISTRDTYGRDENVLSISFEWLSYNSAVPKSERSVMSSKSSGNSILERHPNQHSQFTRSMS